MTGTIALLAVLAVTAVLVATYLTWLSGRHDRLSARAEGAWAALDAQLVRRAAAARLVAVEQGNHAVSQAATDALLAPAGERAERENQLSGLLRQGGFEPAGDRGEPSEELRELRRAAGRLLLARQFHNDAVRDLRALRRRWAARLMHLGKGTPDRGYFDIDDSVLTGSDSTSGGSMT